MGNPELKEYIVTLHKHEDLDEFYQDMETPGGNLYIPNRAVDVANRRPISRNTHYWLTADEAEQIKQDPRVRDVELTPEELGLVPTPGWIDTNKYYSKDTVTTANDRNWGLLRGFDRDHVSSWGSDGTTKVRNSSLNSKLDGTNVDFVIYGYTIDINAPEFAVNEDGTGGSRYFYVNWGDYGLGSTYTQASLTNTRDGAHETICASIAVGNTQGWARKARFTSIPYNTTYYDYVRAWHQAKSVNPQTGFKNPTVVSDSYGYNYGISPSSITSINYRGTTYNGPFTTSTDFSQYKLWLNNTGDTLYGQPNNRVVFSNRTTAQLSDIEDLVTAGVIFVGIAHNWRAYHDVPGGLDYNNTITWSGGTFYYNRGTYASATGAIQVGATSDRADNTPSPRSGRGPRIDIWAPSRTTGYSFYAGETPDGTGLGFEGGVQTDPASQGYLPMIKNSRDTRNSNYYLVKTTDGTSFSGPQVAGVLGLYAELKPDMTPAQALSFLQTYGDSTGVNSTSNNYGDWTSTAGATALALGFSAPTFAITVNKSTVNNSETVTYTITTTNVPNGSTVYLIEAGTAVAGDFVDGLTQVPITTTGDTTLVARTVTGSFAGSKTSILELRTGGYNGTIQTTAPSISLTSTTLISTPTPTPSRTSTPTPSPTRTSTPTPSPTLTSTPVPGPKITPTPSPTVTPIPELSVDVKISTVILVQDVNTTGTIPVIGFGGVGSLSYVITPTLPNGLIFQNSNGTIVGRPNVPLAKTTYTVTVVDKVPQTKKATFDLIVANSQVKLDPVEWLPDSYQDTSTMSKTYGYFIVTDNVSYKNFIVKIVDRDKVALARSVINDKAPTLRIEGNLTTGTATYNPSWSYHVDPVSIEFYFVGPKSCRFPFDNIESNVANLSSYVTPGLICNWELVAEVDPGQIDQEFIKDTEYWSPNNSSQGITVNGEQIRRIPDFYSKFYLVSGKLPDGLTLSLDGTISGNVSLLHPTISNPITEFQYTLALGDSAVSDIAMSVQNIATSAGITLPSSSANAFSAISNLKQLADAEGLLSIRTYSTSVISLKPYYLANHTLHNVYNFGTSYKYFLSTGNQSRYPGSRWRLQEGYMPPNTTLSDFGELTVEFGQKILPYKRENFLNSNLPSLGNLEPEFWDECLKEFMQSSHEYDYQFMIELVDTANVAITAHTFRIIHLRAPTWSEWFMTNEEYITIDPEQYYYYICSSESENITWDTPSGLLGNIDNGQISEFGVTARSDNNEIVHIDFKPTVPNKFPHGLQLQPDGIMSGRVGFRCVEDDSVNLPENNLYTFTLRAYSENYDSYAERQFSIQVNRTSLTPSENIWINAYPYIKQRQFFYRVMNDQNIFPDELIYRPTDPWFGKTNKIRVLFAPGLNVLSPAAYEQILTSNHYDKKLLFGQVKTAVALSTTLNIKYEVVYLTLIDEHMAFDNITRLYNQSVPATIDLRPYISNYYIEDGVSYYILKPNSLLNMRSVILDNVGVKQTNLLPKWMTSPQPIPNRPGFFSSPIGFQFAVVLCYCKPGASAKIARALQSINFNEISFEFDRYQLESRPAMYYDFSNNSYQESILTPIDLFSTQFDNDSTRFIENYDYYADPEVGDKYLKFPKTKVFK